jgi:N utilization substance protein B
MNGTAYRRRARELALALLYELEFHPGQEAARLDDFWRTHPPAPEAREFAERLARGVVSQREAVDRCIAAHAEHWTLDRMPLVDRNILRLATHELLHSPDVPERVVIDEAVELAKLYGGKDSSRFINGVLDKIRAGATRESA